MIFKKDKVYIIAEAGVNHNGDIMVAKKMILEAKKAGVDAIKFQYFAADDLVTQSAKKAPYQIRNTKDNSTQYQMLKKLQLKERDYFALKALCKKKRIDFLLSIFDEKGVNFLEKKLKEKIIKIPSGELTNYFLLKRINLKKTKVILSTGMANFFEIANAINLISKKKIYKFKKKKITINQKNYSDVKDRIAIMQCTTDYPVSKNYINLRCINSMSKSFKLMVGFSDHSLGIDASIASVASGAKIIEKHFTLNKSQKGPDHKASLSLDELRLLVEKVRLIEVMMGSSTKKMEKCEKKNALIARKSLVARTNVKKNDLLNEQNVTCKRPGTGINPMHFNKIKNKKILKNIKVNELIKL